MSRGDAPLARTILGILCAFIAGENVAVAVADLGTAGDVRVAVAAAVTYCAALNLLRSVWGSPDA